MTENDVKNAIIQYLRYTGWLVFRINSGAATIKDQKGKRRWFWFARWFVSGKDEKRAGISDIIGLHPNHPPLAIETKLPGNRPTEAQQEFLDEWQQHGGVAVVAYSLDDLTRALDGATWK